MVDHLEPGLLPEVVDAGQVHREVEEQLRVVPQEREDLDDPLPPHQGRVVPEVRVGGHHVGREPLPQPVEDHAHAAPRPFI